MTTLYIGSSWDTKFLSLANCDNFIHVDPSPNSNGTGYGDKIFIKELVSRMSESNYNLTKESHEKLYTLGESKLYIEFQHEKNNKLLKFYVNTWFPEDIDNIPSLRDEISNIDNLIIEGFNPSAQLLYIINNPINIIIGGYTYYGPESDSGTLLNCIYYNPKHPKIKSITFHVL